MAVESDVDVYPHPIPHPRAAQTPDERFQRAAQTRRFVSWERQHALRKATDPLGAQFVGTKIHGIS
jgi:hypothetical protein